MRFPTNILRKFYFRNNSILHLAIILSFIVDSKWVCANVNIFKTDQQFLGKDASGEVFRRDVNNIFPVAYYDINSDKLTDVIAVSRDRKSINIFLAYSEPPFLRRAFNSQVVIDNPTDNKRIISVRPGEFTGDGVADLMITVGPDTFSGFTAGKNSSVEVIFCLINFSQEYDYPLKCGGPGRGSTIQDIVQEPTVLDLNGDMVLDLLGERWLPVPGGNGTFIKHRYVWVSGSKKDSFEWEGQKFNTGPRAETIRDMLPTSSNAFADIDDDGIPELIIVTEDANMPQDKGIYYLEMFEILKDSNDQVYFKFKRPPEHIETIPHLDQTQVIGQPMIIDFEHSGRLSYLLPYCTSHDCSKGKSGIYILEDNQAIPLPLGGMTYEGMEWGFIPPPNYRSTKATSKLASTSTSEDFAMETFYSRTVSLRVGDYNLDGYPDLLGVLQTVSKSQKMTRAVLFENVVCTPTNLCPKNRTFLPNFEIFKGYTKVISSSFYDISDDGVLDVILVAQHEKNTPAAKDQSFVIQAFKNEMNFDSSFLKVMVLTGQQCETCEYGIPYGNILPGATVKYTSLNSKGTEERGVVVQTYRTSHLPLDLPCEIFGVGHSPNFIETLEVVIASSQLNENKIDSKTWLQIIPNSQVVVVPYPVQMPARWMMKLFLTPSGIVLKTFGILVAICAIIGTIVAALEFKERREDRKVRQSEAHRLVMY